MELLTFSRQDSFKTCRRRHFFAYEQRIRPRFDAKALRMGQIFHTCLEMLGKGYDLATAVYHVTNAYANPPESFDMQDWFYECETIIRLLCGYQWRWAGETIKHVAPEKVFNLPLINPQTGMPSRTFALAGKIDGIIELEDGRLAVIEHKLLSEDLASDSDLWKRMRIDHQVSLYVIAARRLGYPVESVVYDVTRKPTIRPEVVPLMDEEGIKIVLDAHGERVRTQKKTWRQTGDSALGYVLQTRPMTPEEWGDKLNADIAARPDHYYARVEIPRLDKDLAEYEVELWDIAKTIRDAQMNDRHYRTCNKNTCGFCPWFSLCTSGYDINHLPEEFEIVYNIHPELGNDLELQGQHGKGAGGSGAPSDWREKVHEPGESPLPSGHDLDGSQRTDRQANQQFETQQIVSQT